MSESKNRKPPPSVNLQFGYQWMVILPTVYRYEDAQWIDEFFDHGHLRLSTFAKFSTYKDEIRGDAQEGKGVAVGTSENSTTIIAHSEGADAYVLCCSTKLDRDLRATFERNCAFAIENTAAFAVEVARQLPGFRGGLEGHCIYRSDTVVRRDYAPNLENYRLPEGGISMDISRDGMKALGGPERKLLKRKQYESQSEYRFLWHVDRLNDDHIDIVCPAAAKHCRRIGEGDY